MKRWAVTGILVSIMLGCSGWGGGARVLSVNQSGGVVAYSFQDEADVLTSRDRTAAVRLITQKCPTGYTVTREGELSKINRNVDRAWNGQMGSDRVWAIEFRCR
jgi:hypothetical protein